MSKAIRQTIERQLTSVPPTQWLVTTIQIGSRNACTFHVCGCIGLFFAVMSASSLVLWQGLSLLVLAAITATALSTFFALAMLTKIVFGEEELVYYHHEVAILTSTVVLLWILREPILPYLEITLLGIGTFLAFGRMGCLMVGCCHGRPHTWGVCYSTAHADAGFPSHFVGVRLLPVQAMESLSVFTIVLAGVGLIWNRHPPGTALLWYVGAYGLVRFGLEFLRGDLRPYRLGFSEAQWTSLVLMIGTNGAGYLKLLPWNSLHAIVTLGLIALMMGLTLAQRLALYRKGLLIGDKAHLRL